MAPCVEINFHCSHIIPKIQNKFQIGPRSPIGTESGCISIFRVIQVKHKGFEILPIRKSMIYRYDFGMEVPL